MDERTAELVLASLGRLISKADEVDKLFNMRLLDTYPNTHRLFVTDLEPEERRLVQTLKLLLGEVRYFGAILPTVRSLSSSHKVCRLIEFHYTGLAETLIWTLRRSLGPNFSDATERAWHEVLRVPPSLEPARAERREPFDQPSFSDDSLV